MLWQTLQKDLYYPLVADKNSYNSANFEAMSLKFGMVVDLDNTQSQKDDNDDENDDKYDDEHFYAILYNSRILTQGGAPQTFPFLNKLA